MFKDLKKPALIKEIILVVLISFIIVSNSCKNSGPVYQVAKKTIEEVERETPKDFLTIEGTYRMGIIDNWVFNGKITSKATSIQYKDVVIEVNFFTKTNTLLGTNTYTVIEFVDPLKTIPFQLRLEGFKNTEKLGWSIVSATPTN